MTQTVNVIPVELTELRAASTASGGTALTTTLGLTSLGKAGWGADYLSITPRNFAGCAVARVLLNPYLTIFATWDAGKSTVDISDEMQDGDTTDYVLNAFPLTGTGYIYVGASLPFSGVRVDIGTGPNADATTLTVKYWNGTTWVDTGDTDGTISPATKSMGADGDVTWTVPTNWSKKSLTVIGDTLPATARNLHQAMYWTRWEWSAALDAAVDVAGMQAINRATTYAELLEGQPLEVRMSDRELASVQALTNAGTANLVVNVGTLVGSEFE